ncbi:AAA family ATPase [archaeon]|nr:AAA family ATPase [archaeon]
MIDIFKRLLKKESEEAVVTSDAEAEKDIEEPGTHDHQPDTEPPKEAQEKGEPEGEWVKTGIEGFDSLLERGIPRGAAILIAGGPGSGKTIFCLQTLNYAATHGEKCLYMTFEEGEEKLRKHMHDFGWNPEELEKKGLLVIKRFDPFDVTISVEAMLEKARGELSIEITPVLIPDDFKPDRVVVDSLSAIAAGFIGSERSYRIYIEQLFRYFERMGATSFLITEIGSTPSTISKSGVEEFLADGVVVLYNVRDGNIRQNTIEVLKLRGTGFEKKIVPMGIIAGQGIVVYPEQEIF